MIYNFCLVFVFFLFKQKTAYDMRISDWSSDVCSSDLVLDNVELYGRVMYSDLRTRGGSRSGQNPPTTGANGINVQIAENNPFLDPQARARLTFVNGFEIGRASCRERVCKYV